MERPLKCPLRYLLRALGRVFNFPRTHKKRRLCVIRPVCVSMAFSIYSTHSMHGVQKRLHSCDGRVAHTLPHVFDPQESVCVVCSGWFYY